MPPKVTHYWLEVVVGVDRSTSGAGWPGVHIRAVVWDSRVGLGVQQAWRPGQDVICPPGSCRGGGQFPPRVWVTIMQLHQGRLQGGYFIVLQIEGWTIHGKGSHTHQPHMGSLWGPSGSALLPGPRFLAPSQNIPVHLHPSLCSWLGEG